MHNETLILNPNPTKSKSTMNTNVMTTVPADNAGLLAMLKEYIRTVAREVLLELIEEVRPMFHPPTPKENTDHMDLPDVVEFLNSRGYRISAAKIYKLTSKNEIPFQKIDGSNRLHFYRSQLEEWLNLKLIDGNAIGILEPQSVKKSRR